MSGYKYTDKFLLSELQRYYKENNKVPTMQDLRNNKTFPDPITYIKRFSSWNNALKLIGFRISKKYTDEELINELHKFVEENSRVPTASDFQNNKDFPDAKTYQNRFGSWNNALEKAGLKLNQICEYTDEFLLNELQIFVDENNRVPIYKDFINNNDLPSLTAYIKHFKTWNNALELAELKINKTWNKLTGDEICSICKTDKTTSWCYKNDKRICSKCYSQPRNYLHGVLDPNSNCGIGVITEHVVWEVLNKEGDIPSDCKKYNTKDNFNFDYDLISEKYGNINVKSSKLQNHNNCNSYIWAFIRHKNAKIPNNYICLGFDENRSKILKVWIICGNSKLFTESGIKITNSEKGLSRMQQYEVDSTTYNEVYQNLDITTLPEFRNLNVGEINAC